MPHKSLPHHADIILSCFSISFILVSTKQASSSARPLRCFAIFSIMSELFWRSDSFQERDTVLIECSMELVDVHGSVFLDKVV